MLNKKITTGSRLETISSAEEEAVTDQKVIDRLQQFAEELHNNRCEQIDRDQLNLSEEAVTSLKEKGIGVFTAPAGLLNTNRFYSLDGQLQIYVNTIKPVDSTIDEITASCLEVPNA